ncbi:MAG: DUF4412 domain-containing protein [Terriglobales bacterium]
MKRRFLIVLFSLVVNIAFAQDWTNTPQFSADMKGTGRDGQDLNGKIFWGGGGNLRMDMHPQGGRDASNIKNIGKKTSYVVMHEQRMYMEMNVDNPMSRRMSNSDIKPFDSNHPCADREGYTCTRLGSETVNGRSCDKWEVKGPDGNSTLWIDQKLHFPIRSVSSNGHTFDLINVKEGPQPASVFEVPAGYRKMDLGATGVRPPKN